MTSVLKLNYRGQVRGSNGEATVITQVRENSGFEQWRKGGDY